MYTKEQNLEIEKVCRVFFDYIKENPYFDVVWSDKLGYVYLDGISFCSEKEQEKIKDRLLPYMKQLPEYGQMMEELFWD